MSSKTRSPKSRTTATPTLHAVPDSATSAATRTDSEDRLWAALRAQPNSTAADLSVAAKIGKSTAQKILARWATDGSVTRTAGIAEGGRRAADLWSVAEAPDPDASTPAAEPAGTADSPEETPSEGPASSKPQTDEGIDTEVAPAPTHGEAAEPNTSTDNVGSDGQQTERLAPGALRGMVEDFLRDHPGDEFGPTAIAKALGGKSSGAVSNALDKLVADGTAVRTKDKPRRFALAPTEQESASQS
ncbi:MarR family transcriptional regulator [Amycolatopsis thermoflava]|uniref:MarR family transcriptional regulator n=1 Tax=Amycolatopsis thermoflava TaxID=84480 RepID=UPI0037FB8819